MECASAARSPRTNGAGLAQPGALRAQPGRLRRAAIFTGRLAAARGAARRPNSTGRLPGLAQDERGNVSSSDTGTTRAYVHPSGIWIAERLVGDQSDRRTRHPSSRALQDDWTTQLLTPNS